MNVRSPIVGISLGLVLLTISILLLGDLLGLVPNRPEAALDGRKKFCESLAVQLSLNVSKGDLGVIQKTLGAVVERNNDVLSAALRDRAEAILAESGEHDRHWVKRPGDVSTPTHARVPVFENGERWGTVEVSFTPLGPTGVIGLLSLPLVKLALFMAVGGFIAYLFFVRRTLRHLDPSAVIPARVKLALDVLTEGVIVLDEDEQIVLANTAFEEESGQPEKALIGEKASSLSWSIPATKMTAHAYPWSQAMTLKERQTGIPLALTTRGKGARTFMVNAAPILDGQGESRGALVTFDDVTELEEKNEQLEKALILLQDSRDEIKRKNRELEVLATRDPLTDCLNRRSFFEQFATLFETAQRYGHGLCCIMTDVDHFKAINDAHGHGIGDQVLQEFANALRAASRTGDVIGRYGGEEFCILLPNVTADEAEVAAERFRRTVEEISNSPCLVTASFGVSSLAFGASTPDELIDQADKSLYEAKNSGRNRVVVFQSSKANEAQSPFVEVGRVAGHR